KDWLVTSEVDAKVRKEDASYMADNDDKRDDAAGGKKTLTLKGAPGIGGRPGMSRSSRTVVVEKRTRVVRPGAQAGAAAPRPHASQPTTPTARPQLRQAPTTTPSRSGGGLSAAEADARARV